MRGVVVECIVSSMWLEIRLSLMQAHTADVGIERKTQDAPHACGIAAIRVLHLRVLSLAISMGEAISGARKHAESGGSEQQLTRP